MKMTISGRRLISIDHVNDVYVNIQITAASKKRTTFKNMKKAFSLTLYFAL